MCVCVCVCVCVCEHVRARVGIRVMYQVAQHVVSTFCGHCNFYDVIVRVRVEGKWSGWEGASFDRSIE